jgi:hypothetical protein
VVDAKGNDTVSRVKKNSADVARYVPSFCPAGGIVCIRTLVAPDGARQGDHVE